MGRKISVALDNHGSVKQITLQSADAEIQFLNTVKKFGLAIQTAVEGPDGYIEAILTEEPSSDGEGFSILHLEPGKQLKTPVFVRIYGAVKVEE